MNLNLRIFHYIEKTSIVVLGQLGKWSCNLENKKIKNAA